MRIAIIGLPASGKSTLYRLLTHGQPGHQPSRTADSAIAVVRIPDPRLDRLASMFKPKKVTPASIELVDLPPLIKGSAKAGGTGGQVLPQMRQAAVLLAVLRAFTDERVPLVEGRINPAKDAAILQEELLLADLDVVEKRIARIEEGLRKGRKDESLQELALLKRCRETLESERPLREVSCAPEEDRLLRGFQFLTAKPLCLLINIGEDAATLPTTFEGLTGKVGTTRVCALALPAKIELELAELPPDEAAAFRADLGLDASAVPRLLQACYDLLGLLTFFTVGGDDVRAWMISRGSTALQAAGTIHTDIERGFIRAEVVAFDALMHSGSMAAAKKEGLVRLEGKDYLVADGDVITIRFNV